MEQELDDKLTNTFPLLYRDRYASMQSTCMCWGFPGKGWFQITYDLSSKLEPLIQKWIDENQPTKCLCGCEEKMHFNDAGHTPCMNIHVLPRSFHFKWKSISWPSPWNGQKLTRQEQLKVWKAKLVILPLENLKRRFARVVNFVLELAADYFGLTKSIPCYCKKFLLEHPAASQVKEKYGTGRFYMTHSTDEMEKLIREWEVKTSETCEECGDKAELRNDHHWYSTLCEKHAIGHDGKRIPTQREINKELGDEGDF